MQQARTVLRLEPEAPGGDAASLATAGVVHDLGNLIQIAASAINVLTRSPVVRAEHSLAPMLAGASTALDRAGELLHQSRRPHAQPVFEVALAPGLQQVAPCINEIRELLTWICEPAITLSLVLPTNLPPIRCSRLELQNAILNLVINARDAMADGGLLQIIGRRVPSSASGADLEISVVDDGAGMTLQTLEVAFDPYFTTKADRGGTGLGLAMVRRFACAAGGRADIISSPGRGTTVTMRLPGAEMVDGELIERGDRA